MRDCGCVISFHPARSASDGGVVVHRRPSIPRQPRTRPGVEVVTDEVAATGLSKKRLCLAA